MTLSVPQSRTRNQTPEKKSPNLEMVERLLKGSTKDGCGVLTFGLQNTIGTYAGSFTVLGRKKENVYFTPPTGPTGSHLAKVAGH